MSKGIIVFGFNGSGKSTLGKVLADSLNYKYMDIEDYHYIQSDIPYTMKRTRDEYLSLMVEDIKEHENFVLSAVKGDFGEEISSLYKLAVFIEVPYEIRIDRIHQRMFDQFGDRVKKGGDLYESEKQFIENIKTRTLTSLEEWSKTLNCKIIHVDGTKKILDNVGLIKEIYFKTLSC